MPKRKSGHDLVNDAVDDCLREDRERASRLFIRETRGRLSLQERADIHSKVFFRVSYDAVRMRDKRDKDGEDD